MYLIKSKGSQLIIRDRGREAAPMISVGPLKWVPFEALPKGHAVGEDGDVVIREVIDLDKFDGEIESDPLSPEAAKSKPDPDVTEDVTPEAFAARYPDKDAVRAAADEIGLVLDYRHSLEDLVVELYAAVHG